MAISDGDKAGARGGVRRLLRLEGLALLLAALGLFAKTSGDWRLFALLFLVPDVSFAFYLFGPRAGSFAYNMMHSTLGPLILAAAVFPLHLPVALAVTLIWFAHIGLDRALGYGLKYATGFGDTHLGAIGRKAMQASAAH